ncbi:MAG: phage head closure protein [Ruminococcus sp.]|nr:phage head closure protein [Ruminococcus sp.]
MEYTEIIYLISQIKEEDDIGNSITSSETSKKIYAKKQSVRMNEFYNAIQVGLTPSIEFVIKKLNYNGEEELEWNNEKYSIIRTVEPKNKFDIVLVCQKKIGI